MCVYWLWSPTMLISVVLYPEAAEIQCNEEEETWEKMLCVALCVHNIPSVLSQRPNHSQPDSSQPEKLKPCVAVCSLALWEKSMCVNVILSPVRGNQSVHHCVHWHIHVTFWWLWNPIDGKLSKLMTDMTDDCCTSCNRTWHCNLEHCDLMLVLLDKW
jgi:hypothetical protein